MNLWTRFLLWLLDHTVRIEADATETQDEQYDPTMTAVEYLEYCYAISDDSLPAGDPPSERNTPGA